jgi:malate dehydrogenase (oxaloacetate-decarboxylating)(NADP+)
MTPTIPADANPTDNNLSELDKQALAYHEASPPGKISIIPSKPVDSQHDLSLAYSPGVAAPCLAIQEDKELSYKYTARANLIGVISNGSAVLGLGNIGPYASKPVMEGKAMLFKKYADVDVFDIEIDEDDPDKFIDIVKSLEPTFGGVNLEDIKAPECFYIESRLKEQTDIPVFHDDQHGTAVIAAAAFLNALDITERDIKSTKLVVNGAGAAAIACTNLLVRLGLDPDNILMCDSKGVLYEGRSAPINAFKKPFTRKTSRKSLADAVQDADAFLGVSVGGVLSKEMVSTMAERPLLFAMANPDPEILPPDAHAAKPGAIVVTGRSDFPNQVNNVLGFPYIFRGALDAQCKAIEPEMLLAAVRALADLTKKPVPASVKSFFDETEVFEFGPQYLIPKPNDPRVLVDVSLAIAATACKLGVARKKIDTESYRKELIALAEKLHGVDISKLYEEKA